MTGFMCRGKLRRFGEFLLFWKHSPGVFSQGVVLARNTPSFSVAMITSKDTLSYSGDRV